MKLAKWIFSLLLLLATYQAHAQVRYFGYFGNNEYAHENKGHINLHFIATWNGDHTDAISTIMTELATAKLYGLKAIVSVDKLLFRWNGPYANLCPAYEEPNAEAIWASFTNRLVTAGYLVPNNPSASTVVAFYVIDEPEECGLQDQNSNGWIYPHPALRRAINAIKFNPKTASLPIATVTGKRTKNGSPWTGFYTMPNGIKRFDWVGVDCYGCSISELRSQHLALQQNLLPSQRTIFVPQAATGGCDLDGTLDWPQDSTYQAIKNSPAVVYWMPFVWFSRPGCPGARDLVIRGDYEKMGLTIKNAPPPPARPAPPYSGSISASPNPCSIYLGETVCTATISWSSNRPETETELWVTTLQGGNPQLFAHAQSGTSQAPWISAQGSRFHLKIGAVTIATRDVKGVQTSTPRPPPGGGGGGQQCAIHCP